MTRDGIEINLRKSPYRVTVGDNTFVFSSALYAKKFSERLEERKQQLARSLSYHYKINMELPGVAEIALYQQIEKRGFYIIMKGGIAECPEQVKLSGAKLTLKKSAELS